ncbi:MAG TPA: GAF domain-containing protein [Chloroflexi bacterium]|nr:GAF domain-containing protein [Chloroflexota bacterium]
MLDCLSRREILLLGERLLAQPSILVQKTLIQQSAVRLVGGEADLWLEPDFYRLPGSSVLAGDELVRSSNPPSDLMRQALDATQTVLASDGRAAVAVPLVAQERVLGVLSLERPDNSAPFDEDEIACLDDLALQSAIALQSARQVVIARWRLEQLSLVRQVSAQVANVLDLDELAQQVTQLVQDTFKYYFVALFTLESRKNVLRYRASAGPECPQYECGDDLPFLYIQVDEGLVGQVAQTGEEILADDVSHEPHYRYVNVLPETRSEVVLPLKIENRLLGVLDVQSEQVEAFHEMDLLVLRALADNVAIAVEGARLYSDLRRRADQLSAVAEVGQAVASILDIETLFERVVSLIHQQFGYPFVYLLTVDQVRGKILYRAGNVPQGQALEGEGPACSLEAEDLVARAVRKGKTLLVNDLTADVPSDGVGPCDLDDPGLHYPSRFSASEARAEVAIPLIFGDEVLGVLDVQSDQPDAFDDDDLFLFEALADSVAIAMRNANLYRSERWRRQVADGLREVAGLLSAEVDLDHELDAILGELYRMLPCDVAAVWLLRDDVLCLSAAHGYTVEAYFGHLASDDASWLGQALHSDQPLVYAHQSGPDPLGDALGFSGDYSAIAAPLRVGERILGLLTLAHHEPGRYGSESRMLAAAFASYAAVAIENTRLYQETQELAQISTTMLQVAQATQSLTNLDQVLETVSRLAPRLVSVERCAILMWNDFHSAFAPAAAYGLTPAQQKIFDHWVIHQGDEPTFDDLLLNKAPVFVYDVATDSRLSDLVAWDLGFESLLLLPLLTQDEVLGVMLVDYQSDWSDFEVASVHRNEQLMTMQGIALQTATMVDNIRLREAQQEEAYVSAALLQVAQAVANLNDLDDILSTIVRLTPILVGGERCAIYLWDGEQEIFKPAQSYGLPREESISFMTRRYEPGDSYLLDAVREQMGGIVRSNDSRNEGESQSPLAIDASVENPLSLLALPLTVKGDMLGVMVLEENTDDVRLSHKTRMKRLEIIKGIAHQTAMAIQSDLLHQEMAERERLERELQLAHDIQQTFMPDKWCDCPGWDLAFTWRAARQVAGDFYDFFLLPDQRLGLIIADVADKGMPAALFMALTRTLVRAAALEETSPAAVMGRVNDLLVPDARSGMFVTAIYGTLALETGVLTYANAGHNLPLLWRARSEEEEIEQLKKGGMALGVMDGVRVKEHTVSLDAGDCLLFYTDGITEAFSPDGEMYGEERLHETLRSACKDSAQSLLEVIDRSTEDFIGDGAPSDDRTLMVLCREGAS